MTSFLLIFRLCPAAEVVFVEVEITSRERQAPVFFEDVGDLMKGDSPLEGKVGALREEGLRVIEDDFFDHGLVVVARFHLKSAFDDGEGVGNSPVAGGVHPDVFHAIKL